MSWESYRKVLFDKLGYEPTAEQLAIHNDPSRIRLVAGGWQAGKSYVGAKEAVLHSVTGSLIWLVAMTYERTRNYEFKYMVADFEKLGLVAKNGVHMPQDSQCTIDLKHGCRIETKSVAETAQSLGGAAPDFVLGCESGQFPYEVYLWMRGRIGPKRAKMMLTGTFEDSVGWYAEFFKRWQAPNNEDARSFSLPSWSNKHLYPGGRQDPEILSQEAELPADKFNEKIAGIPVRLSNIVLPEFQNSIHVGQYPFVPDSPVELAIDPGYRAPGAYAVVAIQHREGQMVLVDEVYLSGYTTYDIITVCQQKPWWTQVQRGIIDVAGRQHANAKSAIEIWRDVAKLQLESKKVEEEGNIDALRTFLKVNPVTNRPKMLINTTCRGFISECGGCKSPVDGGGAWVRDKQTHKPIDANNHSTKAVGYYIVNIFGYTTIRPKRNLVRVY